MMRLDTERPIEHGCVPVGPLEMYYEIHGSGEPLVLLHGGMTTIESSFGTVIPALSDSWRVIAVEQQAHGHTADIDRPLSFEHMADDTAGLLRHFGVELADFFGYSDGGNVALAIAIRHPELVRRAVVAGTNINNDGLIPGIAEFFDSATADDLGDEMRSVYTAVAPRPEDWPALVKKVMTQASEFEGWTEQQLHEITARILFVVGDSDIVSAEHAVEVFRMLPNAQLAILPGTDHGMRLERPELLLSLIEEFFSDELTGWDASDNTREALNE